MLINNNVRQLNMSKNKDSDYKDKIIHLGSIDFTGKSSGVYSWGVAKLWKNYGQDLLESANSFLKAASRCINDGNGEDGEEVLLVPAEVCASFACELYLKYIIHKETGKEPKGHELLVLYNQLNEEHKLKISKHREDLIEFLERNNKQFVEARYHHENGPFGFRYQEIIQFAIYLSNYIAERK